jgi:DNA-directed RNA polymerase subunit RPC12/RpoP
LNCEKCGSILPRYANEEKQNTYPDDTGRPKTVPLPLPGNERYVGKNTISDTDYTTCPECNYPLFPNTKVCPVCGFNAAQPSSGNRNGNGDAVIEKETNPGGSVCPRCKNKIVPDAYYCSTCGFEVQGGKEHVSGHKTIPPWNLPQANGCHLKPVWNEGESFPPVTLSFTGESIVLNRANTEPGNQTITSKEQALLIFENEKWYLQDRSEHQTTFVRAAGRIELKRGDIIMLGNRRFEFE